MSDQNEIWNVAAKDLGLEVESPFYLRLDSGEELKFTALIKRFGFKKGMVVDASGEVLRSHMQTIRSFGYGFSANLILSKYSRDTVIEILRDWGWAGAKEDKPDWLIPTA